MVFENPPAPLKSILLAAVRGIVGQTDVQPRRPHHIHYALHKLSAMAVMFWAVVEIDDQGRAMGKPFPDGVPPFTTGHFFSLHCDVESDRNGTVFIQQVLQ